MSTNTYTKQDEKMPKMDLDQLINKSDSQNLTERNSAFEKQEEETTKLDYKQLVNTPEFKNLTKRKSTFLRISVVLFSSFYILMPFLTGYTDILEKRAIGYITWTWIYAFGIFAMVGAFSIIYTRRAAKFDKDIEKILSNKIQ